MGRSSFFFCFIMFLAESFAGIIELYNICSSSRQSRSKDKYDHIQRELIVDKVERKVKKISNWKLFLIMVSIALLDLVYFTSNHIISYETSSSTLLSLEIKGLQLFYLIILSNLILHEKLYKHQAFAIGLTIIGLSLVVIIEGMQIEIPIQQIMYLILFNLFVSTRDILEKWLMVSMFINPLCLLFFEGLIGTITLGIFFIVSSFYECDSASLFCEDAIKAFQQMFSSWQIAIYFLFYFICCLFYNLFYLLTKYWFSPTLMVVSDCLSVLLWVIISFGLKSSLPRLWWLVLIGEIFVSFGCLVYNEIVICYFWGLARNTKKEIRSRSEYENFHDSNSDLILIEDISEFDDNSIIQEVNEFKRE